MTTEKTSAITFDSYEEYEAQCQRCTEDGIRQAAKRVWELAKAEAEACWADEERIRDKAEATNGYAKTAARMKNARHREKLEVYGKALGALGYGLRVTVDLMDPGHHVFEVSSAFGTVRSWTKASW